MPPAAVTASDASDRDASSDGTWTVAAGSIAGFRCEVSVFGHVTPIIGHSAALTGAINVSRGAVSSGSFRIDLTSVQICGQANAVFTHMVETARYPAASLILDEPIFLDPSPVMNTTYRAPAAGLLTMHGTTCPVAFTFVARYAGTSLEATGSIAVRFSEWNIRTPVGIKNTGAIEFVLRMRRSACGVSRRT